MVAIPYRLLSLLAPVLRDEGLSGLRTAAESDDPVQVAEGAAAFYAALAGSRQKTAAAYLRMRLYETETVFSAAAAQGDAADMYARVDAELSALGALAATDCEALRRKLPEDARALFPVWEKGDFSCTAKELAREYAQNGYGAVRANALRFDAATRTLLPIQNAGTQRLSDLKEYTEEKEAAVRNTLAFLEGKPANNVLLYGDRGTGKSSTVHALDFPVRLFTLGKELGNADAVYHMGLCYINGDGVEANLMRGVQLIREAASKGSEAAAAFIRDAEQR